MRASRFRILVVALLIISQVSAALPARAASNHALPARSGTPAELAAVTAGTVTDCSNDSDFNARLAGGGSIDFDCGASTIVLSSTKVILEDTEIDGGNQIVLSGGDAHRHFLVNAGVTLTLRNITLEHGFAAGDGGAIYAGNGSNLVAENVVFRNNHTTTSFSGGGIVSYGMTILRDSRFENNSGGGSGAFYPRHSAVAIIESTVFTGNQALNPTSGWGGAILLWDGPQVTIRDSHFEGNRADSGGAIYNLANSRLVMERTQFVRNNAEFSGGALHNAGEVRVSDVTIEDNRAGNSGGGITNVGGDIQGSWMRVVNNQILDVSDDAYGGGIYSLSRYSAPQIVAAAGVVKLQYSTIAGNVGGEGGAIYSSEDTVLELAATTLSGNRAENGGGGAIYTSGASTLTSSTLSGNISSDGGGGIHLVSGSLNMRFNTLSGNSNPTVRFPGGTFDGPPPYSLTGNLVDGACSGVTGSQGFNLETGNTCSFNQATDLPGQNPQLGTLAENGGPTQTHLPAVGSPAIDAGGLGCPMTDQRGFLRPVDGACDIGAIETSAPPLTLTPFPPPPDGPPPGLTPEPQVTPEPPGMPPPIVHSRVPNGVRPTISVAPQAGRAGDSIRVSGTLPPGSTQARIVSMLDGKTMGSVLVTADSNGAYSLNFIIPAGTRAGPLELCATVPARDNAEFGCVPFTINPPAPATLSGRVPDGVTVGNARIELRNASGQALYSTAINPNGSFSLGNIAPGPYQYGIVGEVSKQVTGGVANISPASEFRPEMILAPPCGISSILRNTGRVSATPSRSSLVNKQQALLTSPILGGAPVFDSSTRPIGIYVSGVRTDVTIEALPQASGPVERVIIEFLNSNSVRVGNPITLNAAPWRTTFDMGRLAPSRGNSHPSVKVTPVVDGKEECPYYVDIEVIANPFQLAGVQPNAMVWDAARNVYRIQGIVPHIPGVLPSSFQFPPPPAPSLPYLGRYNNELNAGIKVVGTLDLNGFAHIQTVNTVAHAVVMNRRMLPAGWEITLLRPNLRLPVSDLREARLPFGPYDLIPPYHIGLPFIEVPVISFFGLVDVTVVAGAGFGAELTISGYVKPLKPAVSATLRPAGSVYAELGFGLRVLAGLVGAGATARLDAELATPLTVLLDPGPDVDLDACLNLRFSVRAFVSAVWGLARKDATKEIAKWNGCVSEVSMAELFQEEPTVPDLLAAPVIAFGTAGAQVSAYVENTASPGATPNSQVIARLKPSGESDWLPPIALSDVLYSAEAPVVALVGPEQWPLVVWIEKKLTAQTAAQLGDDMNAIVQRQEVVFRLYRDGQWEDAIYLTDDALADGLPALAGGPGGAVLAWTRDTDGDWLTRRDQRIAVTLFDVDTATFMPFQLLDGGADGLNSDVKAAYDVINSVPYLVWVYDADGDLTSAVDRRLALATWQDGGWALLNPQPLPPRVDSPAITVEPNGVRLAFLVREPASDGSVGLLGNNGVLWTAQLTDGQWNAGPMLDTDNRPIFGEEPALATHGDESLLLFRRFGQADDNSRFGQLAVSRMVDAQSPARPLYLTDEPRQNWQASLAINPLNGQAAILRVSRTALVGPQAASAMDDLLSIAATEAVAAVDEVLMSTADDPVSLLDYAQTADPALESLVASTIAPKAGAPFTVTATVRNVGRNNADGVRVLLYAGMPGSGTLLQTGDLLPSLPFNATGATAFVVTGSGGRQSFYAQITTTGEDTSAGNNVATVVLGDLLAPTIVDVRESEEWVDGLDVVWFSPKDEVVLGYRILRANSADGPFDLLGETSVPGHVDVPLPREVTYCYAVESYNADTISPRSDAVCGMLDAAQNDTNLYLPALQR